MAISIALSFQTALGPNTGLRVTVSDGTNSDFVDISDDVIMNPANSHRKAAVDAIEAIRAMFGRTAWTAATLSPAPIVPIQGQDISNQVNSDGVDQTNTSDPSAGS